MKGFAIYRGSIRNIFVFGSVTTSIATRRFSRFSGIAKEKPALIRLSFVKIRKLHAFWRIIVL